MKKGETYGDKLDRQHRWMLAFWASVVLLAVYIALFTKGETFNEQTVRCQRQHTQTFEGCMGWVQSRAN